MKERNNRSKKLSRNEVKGGYCNQKADLFTGVPKGRNEDYLTSKSINNNYNRRNGNFS